MAAWSWLLIGAGAFVVLRSFVSSKSPIYRQSLLIAVGALLPAVANAFYLLKLVPGFDKDFTPVGYALSGIFFSFGLYFHRLVWLLPVARGVLMQGMETGVLAIDRHGYVVDHNHSIDRALGLDRILVGKRASDFPRIADLTARLGPSLPASAKVQVGERTYHAKAYPFPGAEGGTVFTLEDVSDAERTGQELEAARLQIARAEKLATIGMLTAGIAHEVNNPLAYVQSDLRSLEQLLGPDAEKPSGEELRVLLSSMREGLDRIQSVVRNLLSLARKESSQGSFTDWDANEAISRTVELCRGDFGHATRVELSLADLPPIRARGRELDQVLLNLIANAAWASKLGGKAGRISIRSSAEGSTCVIEVENDGPPIAESDAERIFEPFFTTKPDGVGTGLGLCVSRDIVEKRHNGKLWLASRDPVRFRIELPSG
jgi:signal transduction histidine kinase